MTDEQKKDHDAAVQTFVNAFNRLCRVLDYDAVMVAAFIGKDDPDRHFVITSGMAAPVTCFRTAQNALDAMKDNNNG